MRATDPIERKQRRLHAKLRTSAQSHDLDGMDMSFSTLKLKLDTDGFAAPLPLKNPEKAKRILTFFALLKRTRNPHARSKRVAAMLADPNLIDAVTALCGPNLMIWRSAFFSKKKGSPEIGWHHDKHYQSASKSTVSFDKIDGHFSVLIALSSIDRATGQLEMLPKTHIEDERYQRDSRPYHLRPDNEHFLSDIPPELLATRQGIDIPSCHFLVFHSAVLHRSLAHAGGAPRVGLALRLTYRDAAVPAELAAPKEIIPFGT